VPGTNLGGDMEGQLPKVKIIAEEEYGSAEFEFLLPDNRTSSNICFDQYIINSTYPYVFTNDLLAINNTLDEANIKDWQ
jgi:hypothetical protein